MSIHMRRRNKTLVSALGLIVFVVLALCFSGWSPITAAGRALNAFRSAENPLGTAVVDVRGGASTTSTGTSDATDPLSGTIAQRRTLAEIQPNARVAAILAAQTRSPRKPCAEFS
jgi:hypothetical protein